MQILNSDIHVVKLLSTKVLHVHMVLMNSNSNSMKTPNEFVGLKITTISVLMVILLPAWPSHFYTPMELVKFPLQFCNLCCFIPLLFV